MIKKVTETRSVEVVEDIVCDQCGKTTRTDGIIEELRSFEYATLSFSGGYSSNYDGLKFELQLCQDCAITIFKNRVRDSDEPELPTKHGTYSWGHIGF